MAGQPPVSNEKLSGHNHFEDNIELQIPTKQCRARRRHYFLKRILPAILTLLALFSLFRTTFVCHHHYDPSLSLRPPNAVEDEDGGNKVPLEIHIMSKCPDARDCLHDLIVPTMVQVSEKVNLTMSFIGR